MFTVAETCPRLCRSSSDSNMVAERELSQFVRRLMRLVYPESSIPAEYEVDSLLKPVDRDFSTIDESLYQLHFGQYFRYDVRTQLPFFYRSVQKLLGVICTELVGTWQCGAIDHFSLTPFDPLLVHGGSDDRCIDALVGTCATPSRYNLMSDTIAANTLRQYREVAQFFKTKWTLIEGMPAVDDVITMWFSYPFWSRCQELLSVLNLLFGLAVVGTYNPNFSDEFGTAMSVDTQRSSLHLVRSWFSKMFAGHNRQSLTGLLRVCSTSDMQVSRLTDEARCRPWDRLIKSSLSEALSLGNAVLSNDLTTTSTVPIDDYRSNFLAQLDLVEVLSPPRAGRRSSPIGVSSAKSKKSARRQIDVTLGISAPFSVQTAPKKKRSAVKNPRGARRCMPSASRGGVLTRQSVGRRRGGIPRETKHLQLANVVGSDDDSASEVVVSGRKRLSRIHLDSSGSGN